MDSLQKRCWVKASSPEIRVRIKVIQNGRIGWKIPPLANFRHVRASLTLDEPTVMDQHSVFHPGVAMLTSFHPAHCFFYKLITGLPFLCGDETEKIRFRILVQRYRRRRQFPCAGWLEAINSQLTVLEQLVANASHQIRQAGRSNAKRSRGRFVRPVVRSVAKSQTVTYTWIISQIKKPTFQEIAQCLFLPGDYSAFKVANVRHGRHLV